LLGPATVLERGRKGERESDCEEHQAVAVKGVDGLAIADKGEGDKCNDGLCNANKENPLRELEDGVS
jgi:hypothetical protein